VILRMGRVLLLVAAANLAFPQSKPATSAKPAPAAPERSFSAEVTGTNGSKTVVNSLAWENDHSCVGTATMSRSAFTRHKHIRVNVGDVMLVLPFEIVAGFGCVVSQYRERICTVKLGDGSVVKGTMWGAFEGEGDLGKIRIPLNWGEPVPSFSFTHKAEATAAYVPHGKHVAVVHTRTSSFDEATHKRLVTAGEDMTLTGATFVTDAEDKEACYTRDAYQESFCFGSGGIGYAIGWDKVSSAAFGEDEVQNQLPVTLAMRDGQTRTGSVDRVRCRGLRIEGAAFVGSYKVQASVLFGDWGIAKVEFRQ